MHLYTNELYSIVAYDRNIFDDKHPFLTKQPNGNDCNGIYFLLLILNGKCQKFGAPSKNANSN